MAARRMNLTEAQKAPPSTGGTPLSITFRSLEIFLAVVEEGTLTGAATRLDLSHSAVSQALSTLEQTLGVKLFDRTVRPPTLTLVGHAAARHALRIVDDARKFEADMRYRVSEGRVSLLRIGMLDSFASVAGADVLDQLRDVAQKWTVASGLRATSMQAWRRCHSGCASHSR